VFALHLLLLLLLLLLVLLVLLLLLEVVHFHLLCRERWPLGLLLG